MCKILEITRAEELEGILRLRAASEFKSRVHRNIAAKPGAPQEFLYSRFALEQ